MMDWLLPIRGRLYPFTYASNYVMVNTRLHIVIVIGYAFYVAQVTSELPNVEEDLEKVKPQSIAVAMGMYDAWLHRIIPA